MKNKLGLQIESFKAYDRLGNNVRLSERTRVTSCSLPQARSIAQRSAPWLTWIYRQPEQAARSALPVAHQRLQSTRWHEKVHQSHFFTQGLGGERRKYFPTCTAPKREQFLLHTLLPSLNPNLKLTSSDGRKSCGWGFFSFLGWFLLTYKLHRTRDPARWRTGTSGFGFCCSHEQVWSPSPGRDQSWKKRCPTREARPDNSHALDKQSIHDTVKTDISKQKAIKRRVWCLLSTQDKLKLGIFLFMITEKSPQSHKYYSQSSIQML